jgi:pyruvate decarboxylase
LNSSTSGAIKQDYIWQRIGRFLEPNDIILAESGTAQFGMPDATFPSSSRYITQIFWSSIGYTVGACLGALVAQKELKLPGRVILIVGEGSLQMTVQEIGSYIRYGFAPIIFVINNNGYSIERAINGPKQGYNDVSMLWDHQKMLEFFGARKENGISSKSWKVETVEDLEVVLGNEEFKGGKSIVLCEVVMGKFDYPWRLTKQIEVGRARAKELAEKSGF